MHTVLSAEPEEMAKTDRSITLNKTLKNGVLLN
jgi:hypothetical protein